MNAALSLQRLSHWLYCRRIPLLPKLLYGLNRVLFGVVLPPSVRLEADVVLGYQGLGIVIHSRARVGPRVNIGPGVVIGGRGSRTEVPVIEEGVMIGAGAKVLGPVHVGRCAEIGANAVVIEDVPAGAIVAGVPAKRVISTRSRRPGTHGAEARVSDREVQDGN